MRASSLGLLLTLLCLTSAVAIDPDPEIIVLAVRDIPLELTADRAKWSPLKLLIESAVGTLDKLDSCTANTLRYVSARTPSQPTRNGPSSRSQR